MRRSFWKPRGAAWKGANRLPGMGWLALGLTTALVVLAAASAVQASASETAWWKITSSASPTNLAPGGEGILFVEVSNLGDATANGGASPIVIADKLPVGLTATEISGNEGLACELASLRCTTTGGIEPYGNLESEHLLVTIAVKVDKNAPSGGENLASVSGGGAPSRSFSQPIVVSGTPAGFGAETYELTPSNENGSPDTQAGSHPFELTTTFNFNTEIDNGGSFPGPTPVGLGKDLHFELPPGLVGNPQVIPQCTIKQFSVSEHYANYCPADTAIGVAEVIVGLGGRTIYSVPVFNLPPSAGEPARFGFKVAFVDVFLDTSLRTGGDYGVTVDVRNISQAVAFYGSRVTFWGVPGDPRHDQSRGWSCLSAEVGGEVGLPPCGTPEQLSQTAFLTLPTSCEGLLESKVLADSWEQPKQSVSGQAVLRDGAGRGLSLDGCNRLNFDPTISVAPDGQAASTPTGLSIGFHIPQQETLNPEGLAQAHLRNTTVALPVGVQLSPAAADGLLACPLEAVGLQNAAQAACPEASKVGVVEIKSPLLPNAITGAVYLAAQDENPFGSLVALYIVAQDPVSGVLVKLAGRVTPDPITGQLVATFENTPEVPFEDLRLSFFGSARAPLTTPPLCGTYTTETSLAPWSGNAPATPSSTFEIDSGPNGAPCASPQLFTPGFEAGTTNIQAGAFTQFELTMSRPDADQALSRVEMQMPPGLLGTLSTVKLCPEPQASQGTCGEDSLIGHTIVSAGLGNDPYTVTGGKVFITGPYKGAPFGLSIVNPAKAGPFDLGTVIVRAQIRVDPHDAHLTVVSDPLPTILEGIPLQLQHVQVAVERPGGFTFNATNCNPMQITGTLSSTEGVAASVGTRYQVTNCATLAFHPKFAVSTLGKVSRANGASLHVKLTYPTGPYDANIAKVKVELPKRLPSRLTTLQKACLAATFEANPAACPAASLVGRATATTPVLPVPLTGPAYFVSHGGEAFPSLVVVLQGYGVTVDLVGSTFISKKGITSSTFKTVPDVPVGSFELTLPQGPYSALAANGDLCKSSLTMPTEFIAQNGEEIHQSNKIKVTGCPRAHRAAHRKAKGKGSAPGRHRNARGKRRRGK